MALMRAVAHMTMLGQTMQCVYDYWRAGVDFYSVVDVDNFLSSFDVDLANDSLQAVLPDFVTITHLSARVIHQPSITVTRVTNYVGARPSTSSERLPTWLAFGIQKWVGQTVMPLDGDPYVGLYPIVSGFQFLPGVMDGDITEGVYTPGTTLQTLMAQYILDLQDEMPGTLGAASVDWLPVVYGGELFFPPVPPSEEPIFKRAEVVAPIVGGVVKGISPQRSRKAP